MPESAELTSVIAGPPQEDGDLDLEEKFDMLGREEMTDSEGYLVVLPALTSQNKAPLTVNVQPVPVSVQRSQPLVAISVAVPQLLQCAV